MFENFEKLIKYGINYNQFFYMYLIEEGRIAALYKWLSEVQYPISKEEVNSLYDLGYISEEWDSQFPDSAVLTKKGKKVYSAISQTKSVNKEEIITFFRELYDAYPKHFGSQKFDCKGLKPSMTIEGKYIEGPSGYAKYYYDSIKGDRELHKSIISKIEKAIELNAPNNSIKQIPEIHSTLAHFIIHSSWKNMEVKTQSRIDEYFE